MLCLFNNCYFDINIQCSYSEIFKNAILQFQNSCYVLQKIIFFPLPSFVYIMMGLVSHKLNLKTIVLLEFW